jgi:hypothetical protein
MIPLGVPIPMGNKITGTRFSVGKYLKVEIYQKNDAYFGKIIWFSCDSQPPEMHTLKNTENPNPKFLERKWLGMNVLEPYV